MSSEISAEEQAIHYATRFIQPVIESPFTTDIKNELVLHIGQQLYQWGLSQQSIVEGTKRAIVMSDIRDKTTHRDTNGIG